MTVLLSRASGRVAPRANSPSTAARWSPSAGSSSKRCRFGLAGESGSLMRAATVPVDRDKRIGDAVIKEGKQNGRRFGKGNPLSGDAPRASHPPVSSPCV